MKLLRLLLSKYLLAAAAFALLMLFFDQNSWPVMQGRQDEIAANDKTIALLKSGNERMREEVRILRTDSRALERYAREHYRMKREGEDVYVMRAAAGDGGPVE